MPLAKPLPDLRRQLQEILTEDLAAALNALRELLPEGSEKHKQVLALRARLNDANKERFRNTLSPDEYQRRVDTIRAACFDLIGDLEEGDFEAPATGGGAASAGASAAKQGSVLYRVPHRMPLRKPTICTVRVAIDEEAILEDIVLDDDVRLRQRVEVSDMMRAELLDPEGDVFAIRQLSEPEQLVRDTGYTQWLFSVTPRVEGEHQLLVKVSMMEFNEKLGKYVPREVSILETITIVTETLAPSDSDETPLKATGEHFTLGPDVADKVSHPLNPPIFDILRPQTVFSPPSPVLGQPVPKPKSANRGLRATALLLAFLMVGTTATWALTPPPVRDWWVASIKDDADTYAGYIEKYKDSDATQHLEKAYFRKADKTGALRDLRDYQREYPQGQFREKVLEKIETLQIEAVESIQQQPAARAIMQFVQDFPESERLPELKQAVGNRAELLPVLENAYVASIQAQPSPRKVEAFLRDFPQSGRLPEVAKAVAAEPEVLHAVQPELENAFLQKMEKNPTAPQAEQFLRLFPLPKHREKFERILDKKPALKKMFLQKMEKAAEEQKAREEEDRRRAAEEEAEKARLGELQRRALEEKDATERTRLEKEAGEEAERQRLKKEAEEAERQRLEAEARRSDNSLPPGGQGGARRSGLDMVRVQGGTFTMGCLEGRDKDCYDSEKPAHSVTLSGFQIGKYEVTQADWFEVMGTTPSNFKDCNECPVEQVSWDDVQDFLQKLNAKTGKKYRLPTEAEWEYAARGGHKMPKDISMMTAYAGSNDIGKVAWYSSNSGSKTHSVGQKAPNELGLYDMSGNVYEWCSDWYGGYPKDAQTNPSGPKSGSYRVHRGGGWGSGPQFCRPAYRSYSSPADRLDDIGFRLASSSF